MQILLQHKQVVVTQGIIDVIRSNETPLITCAHTPDNKVYFYEDQDSIYIEPALDDTSITIDIANIEENSIKLGFGAISINAAVSRLSEDIVNTGAIEIVLPKQSIGELYMKVDAGVIVADEDLVKVKKIEPNGFEAKFKGDLNNQKINLYVKAGAILCKIK